MPRNILRTLLGSAARTATTQTADQRNQAHKGVRVHIDVTAASATPSVVFTIQGKDQITGDYYTVLASAAVTAIGDTYLLVYPGVKDSLYADDTAIANRRDDVLPPYWRVLCTHGDADSITYSITAELLA